MHNFSLLECEKDLPSTLGDMLNCPSTDFAELEINIFIARTEEQ
jgi:hypothetical protein